MNWSDAQPLNKAKETSDAMKIRHVLLSMGSSDPTLLWQRVQVRGRLLDNGITDKAVLLALGELAVEGILAMWWEGDDRAFEAAVTSVQAYGLERGVSSSLLRKAFAAPSTSAEHAPKVSGTERVATAGLPQLPPRFASPPTIPRVPKAIGGLGGPSPAPVFSRDSTVLRTSSPLTNPPNPVSQPPFRAVATAQRNTPKLVPPASPSASKGQPSPRPWPRFAIGGALLAAVLLLVVGIVQQVEVGTVTAENGEFRTRSNARRASASRTASPPSVPNPSPALAPALPPSETGAVLSARDGAEAAKANSPPAAEAAPLPSVEASGPEVRLSERAPLALAALPPPAPRTPKSARHTPADSAAAAAGPERVAAPRTNLTKDDVRGTIARYGSRISRCKTAETAGSTVKVSFSIDPSGSVSGAASPDGGAPGACVAGVVAGMKFNAFQGSTIPVTFPFKL